MLFLRFPNAQLPEEVEEVFKLGLCATLLAPSETFIIPQAWNTVHQAMANATRTKLNELKELRLVTGSYKYQLH